MPVGVALREGRRGQPHVAPQPDPQIGGALLLEVAEHAREAASEPVRDVLVDLLAIDAANVVGLEDLRVHHRAGAYA